MARLEITQDEWSKYQESVKYSEEMRARVRGNIAVLVLDKPLYGSRWQVVNLDKINPILIIDEREPLIDTQHELWKTSGLSQIRSNRVPMPVGDARGLFFRTITARIAECLGIQAMDMRSRRRCAYIVLPRQIAMYCVAQHTAMSLPQIGRAFDGRDHTTVLHAVRKIEKLIAAGAMKDPLPYLFPLTEQQEGASP